MITLYSLVNYMYVQGCFFGGFSYDLLARQRRDCQPQTGIALELDQRCR